MFHTTDVGRAAPHPSDRRDRRLVADMLVTTRRLAVAPERLADVLGDHRLLSSLRDVDLGASGRFELTGAPVPATARAGAWRGHGRLHGRGPRTVPYARIEIEISARSTQGCHLWLAPTCRHATRWGGRRLRRYFDLAHQAGDVLARALEEVGHHRHGPGEGRRPRPAALTMATGPEQGAETTRHTDGELAA